MRTSAAMPAVSGLGERGDYYVTRYRGRESGIMSDPRVGPSHAQIDDDTPKIINVRQLKLSFKQEKLPEPVEAVPPPPRVVQIEPEEPVVQEDDYTGRCHPCVSLCMLLAYSLSGPQVALMAYAFYLSGLSVGLVYLGVVFLFALQMGYLLRAAQAQLRVHNLLDLADRTLGGVGQILTGGFYCMLYVGLATMSLVLAKRVIQRIVEAEYPDAGDSIRTTMFWALIIDLAVVFPLLACPISKGISYLIILTFIVVVVFAIVTFTNQDFYYSPNKDFVEWGESQIKMIMASVTLFLYPFISHASMVQVFADMQRPTLSRSFCVYAVVLILTVIFFVIIGVCGYLTFIQKILILQSNQNIFQTSDYADSSSIRLSAILYVIVSVFFVLAYLTSAKLIILQALERINPSKCSWNLPVALLLCTAVMPLCALLQSLADCAKALNLTLAPVVSRLLTKVCFFLPVVFYIRAHSGVKATSVSVHRCLGVLIMVAMLAFAIVGNAIVTFRGILRKQ